MSERIQNFDKGGRVRIANPARVWNGYQGVIQAVIDIPAPDFKHTSPSGNHAAYRVMLEDSVGKSRELHEFYDWELRHA